MAAFHILVDLGAQVPFGAPVSAELLPSVAQAVELVANRAWRQWQDFAQGAPLPSGRVINKRSGQYSASIKLRQMGPMEAEVYSDLSYAEEIEFGAPQKDLKEILGRSLKVRRTKDGRRYLIIPFRWDTPGSVVGTNHMSDAVHGWWQQPGRQASAVVGNYDRVSGTGAYDIKTRKPVTVPGWRYKWGSKLTKTDLAGMGVTGEAAKRQAGMYNFRKPGGMGGGAHSQHITFRTMMEGSSGWIRPAREGLFPAKTTAEIIQPVAEKIFAAAAERDLSRLLGGE